VNDTSARAARHRRNAQDATWKNGQASAL